MKSSWSASRAFQCAASLIILSFFFNQALRVGFGSSIAFKHWLTGHSYTVHQAAHLFVNGMWLIVGYLFSGLRPLTAFISGAGLSRRVTFTGWSYSLFAVGLALVDISLIQKGLVHENSSIRKVYAGGEVVWHISMVQTILSGPFVEETVIQGFLFAAFRQNFSLLQSIIIILLFQCYFHLGLVTQDWFSLIIFLISATTLCFVRERTQNTWNCVLFHAVHNATALRQWSLAVTLLLVVVLLCDRTEPQNVALETERDDSLLKSESDSMARSDSG
jgi:hypothetical protein